MKKRRASSPPKPIAFSDQLGSCRGKRRYASEGHALQGAMLAGVERQRRAYPCAQCGLWHLTSIER